MTVEQYDLFPREKLQVLQPLRPRGTLFLDELGDIPLELQPKLLRVLQEQEFERLGSTQTTRVVASTNRDSPRMVANREFRSDLNYIVPGQSAARIVSAVISVTTGRRCRRAFALRSIGVTDCP